MESLENEEKSATIVDQLETKISFPREIIEDILSRIPAKSVLRFKSVSKPWLSLISDPKFTKLHFNRATVSHRTSLYFSVYDSSTHKQYFFSAADDGGPVAHLMTLDLPTLDSSYTIAISEIVAEGLVCLTCTGFVSGNRQSHAFVINPCTRKIFKLPDPTSSGENVHFLFGFDESTNEHKILLIRKVLKSTSLEFLIYSISTHSWRNIDVELPVGLSSNWLYCDFDGGVCVNSVVHSVLQDLSYDILAFDFVTEKLSLIRTPRGVAPRGVTSMFSSNGNMFIKHNRPRIVNVDGCVGVVCHDRVVENSEIDIYILRDYENRVWVRKTIRLLESWLLLDDHFPLPEDFNGDEIIFTSSKNKASDNVMLLPIYNKMSRCFKLLEFSFDRQFMCSKSMKFSYNKCYVESILPL